MDWDTWQKLYRRLCAGRGRFVNGEQCAAYYEALSTYSPAVVEQAIAKAEREHKSWPTVPVLCEFIRGILSSRPAPASWCDVCHGLTWVLVSAPADAPVWAQGYVYASRCPQCWRLAA